MHEHVTDPYVKKAQQDSYLSRAAYKLLEIDKRDRLIRPGMTVVDLGAAPGSWCQVVVQKMKGQGRVLAIDLLPVAPMPGVDSLEGDFTDPAALAWLDTIADEVADANIADCAAHYAAISAPTADPIQF